MNNSHYISKTVQDRLVVFIKVEFEFISNCYIADNLGGPLWSYPLKTILIYAFFVSFHIFVVSERRFGIQVDRTAPNLTTNCP